MSKKEAEGKVLKVFPKWEDVCLPPDPNVENSTVSLTLYKLRLSKESTNTFNLKHAVLGDKSLQKGCKIIYLHASNYMQCNCAAKEDKQTNACFSYDYNTGFSSDGYKCKTACPFKEEKDTHKRNFKARVFFLVEVEGNWVLAEYTSSLNNVNDVKTLFGKKIRTSLYAAHRITSASHAVIHVNSKKEAASWDKSVSLIKFDGDNYEIKELLTEEEQLQVNTLISNIKEYEDGFMNVKRSIGERKYNGLVTSRTYPKFNQFFPTLAAPAMTQPQSESIPEPEEIPETPAEEPSDIIDGMPDLED